MFHEIQSLTGSFSAVMQASSKHKRRRLTLNHFYSNLVPGSESGNGNLSLGFSKTVKEF
jgi:hypothetical protein